jgi:hypothetical protein
MQTPINRTFICSVVFLDIVEYSRKPVAEQIFFKERLNTLLTQALANIAPNDRIILDTGDGAALSFLGDPEDALYVSLSLREALQRPQPPGPELKIRLGINLGPVRLVKDINGQPNIIGDGINVAQRVMGFSQPGQIMVSRSFYEVVSCLSEGYGRLFHYEGSRTDKHVREHEIYTVQATTGSLQRDSASFREKRSGSGAVVLGKLSETANVVTDNLRRKPRLGTGLAVVAILSVAVGLRMSRQPAAAPVAPSTPTPPKVAAAPAPARAAAAVPPAKKAIAPSTPAAAPTKPATAPARTAAAPARSKPATPAARTPSAIAADDEPVAVPGAVALAAAPATLTFAISPWGEVHINGRMHGISPPLRNVELAPGRHRVEIRNANFPPYIEVVDARSGGKIRIRHKFQN